MRYPKLSGSVTIGGVSFDYRMAIVMWVATIVLMLFHYHPTFLTIWLRPVGLDRFGQGAAGFTYAQVVLFFLVPLLAILLMGDSPRAYGLTFGKWKEGLMWTVPVCAVIFVALWFLVPGGDLQRSYAHAFSDGRIKGDSFLAKHIEMLYNTGVLLFAWEFLLRGFCLFGIARVLGPGPAIFFQMIPFALFHIGKDELETMTTWLSGVGFGFVAWRTQSCLYGFFIHWFMLVMTILIAAGTFHF